MTTEALSPIVAKDIPTKDLATAPRPPLRLWLPLLVLALFWAINLTITYAEMAMFPRFVSRMILHGVLLLHFLIWCLACRHFRFLDRLLAIGMVIGCSIGASLVADKSMDLFAIWLTGLPFVFTFGIIWLAIAYQLSAKWQRIGFLAVNVLVFGMFALLRWDGLDGRQRSEFSWRWQPSAEQQFLADSSRERPPPPPANAAQVWQLQPGDWPGFRGGKEDIVEGIELSDWKAAPPNLVWKRRVGPGWSSVIVVDGHVVTQEQRGESEAVVCYDAETGQKIWSHEDKVRFYEGLAGAGPRGTPTFAGGRIYSLGAKGMLNCLSSGDGKVVWSKDIIVQSKAAVPMWGLSVSPLVVDDLVVVFAGGEGSSLQALRADSGELAWKSPLGTESYSSPQLVTIGGVRQILMHDNRGLHSVDPASGSLLWEHKAASEMSVPMLQPHLVDGNQLLLGWDSGIIALAVEQKEGKWSVSEKWATNNLKPTFNDFFVHDGQIYGLDDGMLACLDLATGNRKWKRGRYGFGQLLLLPDQDELLVAAENGSVVRVAIAPTKPTELGKFKAIQGKTWNHPVIAHGRLYVRNGEEMACFDLTSSGGPAQ